jgi:hypothetical protein
MPGAPATCGVQPCRQQQGPTEATYLGLMPE